MLTISKQTQRRFILGKQGLYPGRRWRGKEGTVQAVRAGCVVQIDPLNVVARSHDIVLYGRVLDYRPVHLEALLYEERAVFDYGGTVMVHLIEELPYWRVVMQRKQQEPRRVAFAVEHAETVEAVLGAIRELGPLSARDFSGASSTKGAFRSGKVANQALYYLWIAGELMTHSRRGFERVYDLRERVAPDNLNYAATAEEADSYFARKVFSEGNMLTARSWRNWLAGKIERKVEPAEGAGRLDALIAAGEVAPVSLEDDHRTPRYISAGDLPLLETLHAGSIPSEWEPLDTSTEQEMIFLAPLEIASARGRALPLFGFEYLWEVYKPPEKRRWGYYTLPILYQDRLVARFDPKLDRDSGTLVVKGFWLEEHASIDERFVAALARAFNRFLRFTGAGDLDVAALHPAEVREGVQEVLTTERDPGSGIRNT